jgi:hypothetical protein
LVVVSKIMLYFKLDNINNDHFWLRVIEETRHSLSQQDNLQNKIMVIKLQEIINDDTTMIPKITHQSQQDQKILD